MSLHCGRLKAFESKVLHGTLISSVYAHFIGVYIAYDIHIRCTAVQRCDAVSK